MFRKAAVPLVVSVAAVLYWSEIFTPGKRQVESKDSLSKYTFLNSKGEIVTFESFQDNTAVLIVNVATECGKTVTHYNQLEALYKKYAPKLKILAFPCNQFGVLQGQEPGELKEILDITAEEFGRTFELQSKIDVKGPNALPMYREVLNKDDKEITWNFHKFVPKNRFLVRKDGTLVGSYKPKVTPFEIEDEIVKILQ